MPLTSLDRDLYAAFPAYSRGDLFVEPPHHLHWSVAGNPRGVPVLFLHGGPGGGCYAPFRRFFDPVHYKVIMVDQRGAGQSTPYAEIKGNTTQALLDDIEALRQHLGISRWIVFGGSWGATLALLLAQRWPDRCLALCLRGVFLARSQDIDWFLNSIPLVYPEVGAMFQDSVQRQGDETLLAAYYRGLCDPDPAVHGPLADAWSFYVTGCYSLEAPQVRQSGRGSSGRGSSGRGSLALARLEAHYMQHNFFIRPNQILDDMDRIADIPGIIVQGRHDMICPPSGAYALAQRWPKAQLRIIERGAHNAMEPAMRRALVGAMEHFKAVKA